MASIAGDWCLNLQVFFSSLVVAYKPTSLEIVSNFRVCLVAGFVEWGLKVVFNKCNLLTFMY